MAQAPVRATTRKNREDIAWHIINLILPLIPQGCFLAGIGHTAAPAFMSDCERERPFPKHEEAIDMLCILPSQSFDGQTYEVSTRRQFRIIEGIVEKIVRAATLPGAYTFDKPDGSTVSFKRNTTVEVSTEAPDNILKPRYLFPGMFVEIKYKDKALLTIAIEINTGIDTMMLQQAIVYPGDNPLRRVNIYGMAILLYYGMRDNKEKLKWAFDTMMEKCHKHLEAVRLGGGGPDIIPVDREPPSDIFISDLIGICNHIFRACIIIDYRNTGKNMLDYLLKLLNPQVSCTDTMRPVGQVSSGPYNELVGEVIGNRLLQLAYGVVGGRPITMRQAINAAIGEIDRAITPLGGIIAKSGGEVSVYKGMPDKFHATPLFSTSDIDTKVWVTSEPHRDEIYEIITDKLIALVKCVNRDGFMDNYVTHHNGQFPTGIDTHIFGKAIKWTIAPCRGELSASARTIKINPYAEMRSLAVRTPITLFSMDTYARSTYGIYNIAGVLLMSCTGYLVCSPLDIAIVSHTQTFEASFVQDVPGQASDIQLKILSNEFMRKDIKFLLTNKARLAIPGKHKKDLERFDFFKKNPGFRIDTGAAGVRVVELLSSCYGLDMFGLPWTAENEAFFGEQARLVLAAAINPTGKHKTPKNQGEPDEHDHRDADGGMDLGGGGGGKAVSKKINRRTRRRVKNYKQKSNKLTRNKK
jgi:hypothetical protein